jgi:hypothetical protein
VLVTDFLERGRTTVIPRIGVHSSIIGYTPEAQIDEFCQLPDPLRERLLSDSVEVDVVDGEADVTLPNEPRLGISSPEGIEDEYEFVSGKGYVFE